MTDTLHVRATSAYRRRGTPSAPPDLETWRIEPGAAHPLRAHVVDGGVNLSAFSENATAVELLPAFQFDHDQDLDFQLPDAGGRGWRRAFDTALRTPLDACEPGREPAVAGSRCRAAARSAVVLASREE